MPEHEDDTLKMKILLEVLAMGGNAATNSEMEQYDEALRGLCSSWGVDASEIDDHEMGCYDATTVIGKLAQKALESSG